MKKIAAIDFGLKRVGLAFCFDGQIVLPQKAIVGANMQESAKKLSKTLQEWGIELLVVGLPKGGSAQEEMEKLIKEYITMLDIPNMKIEYIDEAFSSYEAKELTKGKIKHKRDGRLDSIAAKIILERFLGG